MKKLFIILSLVGFGVPLFSQELDFLDKVNEKPKAAVKAKEEIEPISEKKPVPVATLPIQKKKKEKDKKKKNGTDLVVPLNPAITQPTTVANPIVPPTTSLPSAIKPVQPLSSLNQNEVGELSSLSGVWLDPEIKLEPSDLIGFVTLPENVDGEGQSEKEKKLSGKQSEGFFGFFDKYKKAMLILGFIILFAFYRLKMSKPSSNSRSYRR